MPFISRITIYTTKSFDGHSVSKSFVLPSGALRHDRQFALVDSSGRFINAKRTPLVHRIRFWIDPENREFSVGRREHGDELQGNLDADAGHLSEWLSEYFSLEVSIVENEETGFPDDLDSPGPTIVSTATLETVATWFPGFTGDDVRMRFRPNIEVGGVDPFWEDHLFRGDRRPRPFRIGGVLFGGINPCQRCVVPTRDPITGQVAFPSFAKLFQQRREETLPIWSDREPFDHYYRLSTNVRRLDIGTGIIKVQDAVELVE